MFCCTVVSSFPFPLSGWAVIAAAQESIAKSFLPGMPTCSLAETCSGISSEITFPCTAWLAHVIATCCTLNIEVRSGQMVAASVEATKGLFDHGTGPSLWIAFPGLRQIPWVTSGPTPFRPIFQKMWFNLPSFG